MNSEANRPPTEDGGQTAGVTHSLPDMPHSEKARSVPPSGDGPDHDMNVDTTMGNTSKVSTASKSKKKGTASTVKGPPKRARPSTGAAGAKKPKGGGIKKHTKSDVSSKQPDGGADPAAAAADDGGGNSSESDNGPYCLCRGPDDHRFMIACDRCEDWFHGECIGMDKHTGENLVQRYICPNCAEAGRYTTRYKKMCSLVGCRNPARIYDAAQPSIFCSAEHCQAWWEQLVAKLPRTKSTEADFLTQEEFMGLLDAPLPGPSSLDGDCKDLPTSPWKLGKPPFETPPNFWSHPSSSSALTPEEHTLLTTSASARYQLGEEIVLCKKMLQLIELALKRRDAAVAAGRGTAKDLCGYDFRLDSVGATHQFARFLASPQGEAIFKTGRLDPPDSPANGVSGEDGGVPIGGVSGAGTVPPVAGEYDPLTAGMCTRKKCKPHGGWGGILTKAVKHDMKELAAQAKEMLDAEQRVRDGAAGRFRRRMKEKNGVRVVYAEQEKMEVDGS
ncbi:hypothetical protein VTI74DRAFT_4800 [Chaetomium olivicolor]